MWLNSSIKTLIRHRKLALENAKQKGHLWHLGGMQEALKNTGYGYKE